MLANARKMKKISAYPKLFCKEVILQCTEQRQKSNATFFCKHEVFTDVAEILVKTPRQLPEGYMRFNPQLCFFVSRS